MLTQARLSEIAYRIIGCAIEVQKHLGPGLLESLYHEALEFELISSGVRVASRHRLPVRYKGQALRGHLELDLLVEDCIVVELKAVEAIAPIHRAQLLSYLKLLGKPKGLLINFHCDNISKEVVSLVTEDYRRLPPR